MPLDRSPSRTWLLLPLAAFLLGGCHARSHGCHAHGSSSGSADGVLVAFYVFYLLGWILVSAAEG